MENKKENAPKYLQLISKSAEDKTKDGLQYASDTAKGHIDACILETQNAVRKLKMTIQSMKESQPFDPTSIVVKIGELKHYENGLNELLILRDDLFSVKTRANTGDGSEGE